MAKILGLLKPLCAAKAKVQRKHVEQVIGILIWYTTGASWLRPWLSTFYKLLYKPHAIPKKLSVQQFEQLRVVLGHDLSVRKPLPALDVDENWKLHSVCGSVVSSLNSQVLQAPRVHQGSVSVLFFSQNHPSTRTCEESAYAAKLFVKAVSFQAPFPLYWQMGGALIGPLMPMLQKQMQVLVGGGCQQVARWLHKIPCGFKFHCSIATCRPGFAAHNPTCSVTLLRWKRWRSWFYSFCRCKKQQRHRCRAFLFRYLSYVITPQWLVCLQKCCHTRTLYPLCCKQSATSLASWASFCKCLTLQA